MIPPSIVQDPNIKYIWRAGSSVKSMHSSPEDLQWAASTLFGFQDSLLSWAVTSSPFLLCPPLTHSVCSWAALSHLTPLSPLSFIYSLAYQRPSCFSTHSQAVPCPLPLSSLIPMFTGFQTAFSAAPVLAPLPSVVVVVVVGIPDDLTLYNRFHGEWSTDPAPPTGSSSCSLSGI